MFSANSRLLFPLGINRPPLWHRFWSSSGFISLAFISRLHSDQGRNFEGSLIHQPCLLYGVVKSRTTRTIQRVMANASGSIGPSITSFVHCRAPRNGIVPPVCRRCCFVTTQSLIRAQASPPFISCRAGTSATSRLSPGSYPGPSTRSGARVGGRTSSQAQIYIRWCPGEDVGCCWPTEGAA